MGLTAPTHHIGAAPGAFAKTVLMPGDPLRAQYIAENYLDNVVKINGNTLYVCLYRHL